MVSRTPTDYEVCILRESKQEFAQLQTMRNVLAQHCEEIAELVDPPSRNTFYYGSYNFPGQKKTDRQVDASAMMALQNFGAILDSLLTPRNSIWHTVEADNPYLMKSRRVRLYFETVTKLLFKLRYATMTNFSAQNQSQYRSLGAYGTGTMLIDAYSGVDGGRGLRYVHLPFGEMFLRDNHQGLIDGFCRWFRMTPIQAVKMARVKGWELPDSILVAAEQAQQMPFDFLHRVCPRDDYDPSRWDHKGMLYGSYYICLTTDTFLGEGGYKSFPIAASRFIQTPGETYGRSPAMMVLPAIKTLNAEKTDFLTQGHLAVAPPWLTPDDGLTDINRRPGTLIKGGMSSEGKPLISTVPVGNINISKEMMDEERSLIGEAFFSELFKFLLTADAKVFTATQITEMVAQRGILIAPVIGRQQSEYLGPLIEREIDVANELRLLPPMPPELREAKGEYKISYRSPIDRDMRAQEVAGAMRTVNMAVEVVNATGDPSPLDRFNFDKILADSGNINGMPESWMNDDATIQKMREARAQAQERQMQAQEAPAKAALMKAGAAQKQAGLKPGQLGPETGPVVAPAQQAA